MSILSLSTTLCDQRLALIVNLRPSIPCLSLKDFSELESLLSSISGFQPHFSLFSIYHSAAEEK